MNNICSTDEKITLHPKNVIRFSRAKHFRILSRVYIVPIPEERSKFLNNMYIVHLRKKKNIQENRFLCNFAISYVKRRFVHTYNSVCFNPTTIHIRAIFIYIFAYNSSTKYDRPISLAENFGNVYNVEETD